MSDGVESENQGPVTTMQSLLDRMNNQLAEIKSLLPRHAASTIEPELPA